MALSSNGQDVRFSSWKSEFDSPWGYNNRELSEWSIEAVLKTVELKGSGGSNPSLSANGALVQLVRMPPCHGGGQGFESPTHRTLSNSVMVSTFLFDRNSFSSNLDWTTYRGVEQLVARQAHNLEVTGSSPVPATMSKRYSESLIQDLNNGQGIGPDILKRRSHGNKGKRHTSSQQLLTFFKSDEPQVF